MLGEGRGWAESLCSPLQSWLCTVHCSILPGARDPLHVGGQEPGTRHSEAYLTRSSDAGQRGSGHCHLGTQPDSVSPKRSPDVTPALILVLSVLIVPTQAGSAVRPPSANILWPCFKAPSRCLCPSQRRAALGVSQPHRARYTRGGPPACGEMQSAQAREITQGALVSVLPLLTCVPLIWSLHPRVPQFPSL